MDGQLPLKTTVAEAMALMALEEGFLLRLKQAWLRGAESKARAYA